jgi:hypothetical protein
MRTHLLGIRLIHLSLLVGLGLASAHGAPPAADYELLFADEFSGDHVDLAHWNHRVGRRSGTSINGMNLAQNVRVEDGHLIVAVKHELIDGRMENTGGGLISKQRFGYGYYEVRSQPFMRGRGVHTAFWQKGMGGAENNAVFEIDSHEIDSTQRIACNNLYVDVSTRGYMESAWPHRAQVPLVLPADGWWIDAYEYTPDGVIFYDQGREVARAEFPDLVAAQNVWLTALNGVGTVDANRMPGESRFDYFRFYARDYPGANLLPNGGFEFNQDKTDLQHPVSWSEEGAVEASRVVRGDAFVGDFKLRHGSDRAYAVTTRQSLEFIRNGEYELRARIRRGGSGQASVVVSGHGGPDLKLDLPTSTNWVPVRIDRVMVATHGVTVSVVSSGGAADWLEIDEIQFMKPPLPGQEPRPTRSFAYRAGDPIWSIGQGRPIEFSGDEKFYFFGRNCGAGEAMTVTAALAPSRMADALPIARLPKSDAAGWALGVTAGGDVFLRVGSRERHADAVARGVLKLGKTTQVAATFLRGEVCVYVGGELKARVNTPFPVLDYNSAPGRLGANSGRYDAVGDVTLGTSGPSSPQTWGSYSGRLGQVNIYNRSLSAAEVVALKR